MQLGIIGMGKRSEIKPIAFESIFINFSKGFKDSFVDDISVSALWFRCPNRLG